MEKKKRVDPLKCSCLHALRRSEGFCFLVRWYKLKAFIRADSAQSKSPADATPCNMGDFNRRLQLCMPSTALLLPEWKLSLRHHLTCRSNTKRAQNTSHWGMFKALDTFTGGYRLLQVKNRHADAPQEMSKPLGETVEQMFECTFLVNT